MKKILTLLLISAISQMLNAQIPSYIPKDSLVGWWPFNGNANDESGHKLNGTVTGASLTNDRFNSSNSAYDFNYSTIKSGGQQNQEIYIPYSPLLNISKITVSYWVFARQFYWSGNPNLSVNITRFQYGYSNPNGQVWGIGYTDKEILGGLNGTNGSGTYMAKNSSPIKLDSWNNVVMTYDGAYIKLYLNSVLIPSNRRLIDRDEINILASVVVSWIPYIPYI